MTGAERSRPTLDEAASRSIATDSLKDTPDAALVATLTSRGYVVGLACSVCGRLLTAARSVAEAVGPTCRRRR
ncbi:DUF6011 domain-containing protein [Gordonia sp. SND2]|uniref:DUF6011 domain-containing protein n=1 Tax=Gordonia sp. SND2 TaxID=3388659 RepID=UPI00398AC7EF